MEEEENIMNLLPPRPVIYEKEKRHVSLHHGRVVQSGRRGRQEHATMGPPTTLHPPSPAHYLKKHHRDAHTHIARVQEEQRQCEKRPPLPNPVNYPPPERQKSGVNWIRKNVAGVGKSTHQQGGPGRYADTSTGTTHLLLTSGLYPNYIYKKGYGRVPSYLRHRKVVEEEETAAGRKKQQEEEMEMETISQLTKEEKQELIEGLRYNQRQVERRLQCLPVLCETRITRERRRELEEQLAALSTYLHLLHHYDITLTKH
ncbi:hypothetical protein Pcinc_012114 [Petrolisthes cinctipes]|uniref:Enkurin domain-containing protein n=1 Tax=Petrolisthes cinctipes TaxID=88211 RepID=A0AAE1G1D5_PETCI|nr:hypothetical protein Pcinc_012114 [Petrolisthes cinctipes]